MRGSMGCAQLSIWPFAGRLRGLVVALEAPWTDVARAVIAVKGGDV